MWILVVLLYNILSSKNVTFILITFKPITASLWIIAIKFLCSFFLHYLWKQSLLTFGSSAGKESTCNAEDLSSILGSGRSAREGIGFPLQYSWASLLAQLVKNLPAMRETQVQSLGWEDPMEKGKATHSSILSWRSPWTIPWGRKELDMTERLSFFFPKLIKIILFIYLFLFVVNFVIHWNETAMSLHVFPIPIPPPTSLSTRSL